MRIRTLGPLAIVFTHSLSASAALAQDWLLLESDRLTVVSELNEKNTREWAHEFGRFIDSLHRLLPLNQNLLPPLTAVIFKRSGGFSPYRVRTESGVAIDNSGVFVNAPTWSVIGVSGARRSAEDYSTTYHEAVHWYMSADPTVYPLWFREGIAEVFSTFEIRAGFARWGRPQRSSLGSLRLRGLQPMEEFLEVTQDEAMHVNSSYYSQAWLFVHYLLFGRTDDGAGRLGRFLSASEELSHRDAFIEAFEMSFDELDRLLRDYVRNDQFNTGTVAIEDFDDADVVIRPAAAEEVELSLARLAFGTRNYDALERHLEQLLAVAPDTAEAYDLMAAWRVRLAGTDTRRLSRDIVRNLDKAIALGSRDSFTYRLKAASRFDELNGSRQPFTAQSLDAEEAQEIAGYLVQSADLLPTNLGTFRGLADVLFSIDVVRESYERVLETGASVHPRSGIILIGQAALALARDDSAEAGRLVDLALTDAYELTERETAAAKALRGRL